MVGSPFAVPLFRASELCEDQSLGILANHGIGSSEKSSPLADVGLGWRALAHTTDADEVAPSLEMRPRYSQFSGVRFAKALKVKGLDSQNRWLTLTRKCPLRVHCTCSPPRG